MTGRPNCSLHLAHYVYRASAFRKSRAKEAGSKVRRKRALRYKDSGTSKDYESLPTATNAAQPIGAPVAESVPRAMSELKRAGECYRVMQAHLLASLWCGCATKCYYTG